MKKITIVVSDEFDSGSIISLIGRDLIMAHIGEYRPPVPTGAKPNGVHPVTYTESETIIETGRHIERSMTPGLTRNATTRNRLKKQTLRSIVEDYGKDRGWFAAQEIEDISRELGYAKDSGVKVLSTMKCNEQIEWDKKSNKFRLLNTAGLVEF